jgi:hypothetical protein
MKKTLSQFGILTLLMLPFAVSAVNITSGTRILGNLSITGSLSKGSGTFIIDHPLDPHNKLLSHSFVESPDMKNVYDGIATLDQNGEAVVELPAYFEALNRDFRYQLEGHSQAMPDLYVKTEIRNNRFTIAGGYPDGAVSWQVTGTRHDQYIMDNPIIPEMLKSSSTVVSRGSYLHPELYPGSSLYGQIKNIFGSFFR